MYSIYEIKGVKIGCTRTDEFKTRQHCQRKKGKMTLLEEYTCIYKASDRERELQAEKGYKVDTNPYWYTVTVQQKLSKLPKAKERQAAKTRKPIIAKSKEGTITRFISTNHAGRALGIRAGDIRRVLNPNKPHSKSYYGYTFEYA